MTIIVDCDVLQADGGTRTTAISGGWVAVYEALRRLAWLRGEQPARYLRGQVAAVSVGIVNGRVVCDLDYSQDSQAKVDMNIVIRDAELVEVQGTGEQGTFSRDELHTMLDAAEEAIQTIYEAQREALAADG